MHETPTGPDPIVQPFTADADADAAAAVILSEEEAKTAWSTFSEHYKFTVGKSYSHEARGILKRKAGTHSYDLTDFWDECWTKELYVPRWLLCESLKVCRQDLVKVFSLHISDQHHTDHDVLMLMLTMPPQVNTVALALQEFAAVADEGRGKKLMERTACMLDEYDQYRRAEFIKKKNSFSSWFGCFMSSPYSEDLLDTGVV